MSLRAVEKYTNKRNIRGLCRLLSHKDATVRRKAVMALGQLGEADGVPCLKKSLMDADGIVLQYTINALWAIGTVEAIEVLTLTLFSSDRKRSSFAHHALANSHTQLSKAVCRVYDIIHSSDWQALETLTDESEKQALRLVLRSDKYVTWPSAKRKELLRRVLGLGIRPEHQSRELAGMGLFVGGIHSIFDVLRGIYSQKDDVRIGAATRLADTNQRWARNILFRRFQREARRHNNREVTLAFADALLRLGDTGPITYYDRRLGAKTHKVAKHAAQMLSDIGSPKAIRAMARFVLEETSGDSGSNVPMVLDELEKHGHTAVEELTSAIEHPSRLVRLLFADLLGRSIHPQSIEILVRLAQDDDRQIQQSALDALAAQNSQAAADALLALYETSEKRLIARALASMTVEPAIQYLKQLVPQTTTVQGQVLGESLEPLAGAVVQVVEQRQEEGQMAPSWHVLSARGKTDSEGTFYLSVLLNPGDELDIHLKVTAPDTGAFTGEIPLTPGEAHQFRVRLDLFFKQLYVRRLQAELD